MQYPSRRQFLASTSAAGILGTVPSFLSGRGAVAAPNTTIRADTRVIEVSQRAATVLGLVQLDGSVGLTLDAGQHLRARLENRLNEATLIHWHGLTPPWQQDGVPDLSQPALSAGAAYDYDFPLDRPGTNWMHSHQGLQEQRLLAAPLIIRDPAEAADIQEVVVLFHDFAFRDPDEILTELRGGGGRHSMRSIEPAATPHGAPAAQSMMMPGGMNHGTMAPSTMQASQPHFNDVEHDAFLANDRTLDDPQVFRVERGGRIRLRLINGAAATNFWLDLNRLEGRLVAVDGMPIASLTGRRFEFAIAQRLDIMLELPSSEDSWPIFAVREGDRRRTGFVLATSGGSVEKISSSAGHDYGAVGLDLERRLQAAEPLAARNPDRRHTVTITERLGYVWVPSRIVLEFSVTRPPAS